MGMYLGFMFLMVTVLIIYYKQISEGYDDKGRYKIMQQVGMDKTRSKKIHSKPGANDLLPAAYYGN